MKVDICVIGAGIVGVTTALELQSRGAEVLLVDRGDPGAETSYGNAGVLSASIVLNVNNPTLIRRLPKIVLQRMPYVRYDLWHAMSRTTWLARFLQYGRSRYSVQIARALQALQAVSMARHRKHIADANAELIFRENGWLKVYSDAKGYRATSLERDLMDQLNVAYTCLSGDEIREHEPGLRPVYEAGLLMHQTCSVVDPHGLTNSYLNLFVERKGAFHKFDVAAIRRSSDQRWVLSNNDSEVVRSSHIVIACGPWSPDICATVGYSVPLAWERGYHMNVQSPQVPLSRPVCDVQRGFVMAPQGATTRITSGVEFAHRDARPNYSQIQRAVDNARTAAPFGEPVDEVPWMGARPTLPDGLPMIGRASRHEDLWFNFGHQHIGMGASAGSAVVLADLMAGEKTTDIEPEAYSPARFRS